MSGVTTALIAGGSALGGGVVVALANYMINRAQARDAHSAELRRVLTAFLSVILRIDHQLRIEPQPGKAVRAINHQMARSPWFDYSIGRIRQRLFEPHLDRLVDSMHEAMAATMLIAPLELLPPLEAVSQLMADYKVEDRSWRGNWGNACADLTVAFRITLGEAVGEPLPVAHPPSPGAED